jgi:hypothetical protein
MKEVFEIFMAGLISGIIVGLAFGFKAGQMSAIKKLFRIQEPAPKDK